MPKAKAVEKSPRLLTARQLAKAMSVPEALVNRWLKRGLPFVRRPGVRGKRFNLNVARMWRSRFLRYLCTPRPKVKLSAEAALQVRLEVARHSTASDVALSKVWGAWPCEKCGHKTPWPRLRQTWLCGDCHAEARFTKIVPSRTTVLSRRER